MQTQPTPVATALRAVRTALRAHERTRATSAQLDEVAEWTREALIFAGLNRPEPTRQAAQVDALARELEDEFALMSRLTDYGEVYLALICLRGCLTELRHILG